MQPCAGGGQVGRPDGRWKVVDTPRSCQDLAGGTRRATAGRGVVAVPAGPREDLGQMPHKPEEAVVEEPGGLPAMSTPASEFMPGWRCLLMRTRAIPVIALTLVVLGSAPALLQPPAKEPPKQQASAKPAEAKRAAKPEAALAATPAPKPAATSKPGAVYFASDLMPLLTRLGCNLSKCHGAASGRSGFKLSMFGADAEQDYAALTKFNEGRRVNKAEPLQSLFLLKATASIPHKGGKKVEPGSADYNLLASWVAQGAQWRDENAPELVSIMVAPAEKILAKGENQPLRVAAVYSDGTEKDMTGFATYSVQDEGVASVAGAGRVKAEGFGQTIVIATYMRRFGTVRVVVPQPLPSPFPDVKPKQQDRRDGLREAEEAGHPAVGAVLGPGVLSPRLPRRDRHAAHRPTRPARSWPTQIPRSGAELIDRLLAAEEFADFWALKWGDLFRIKSEFPVNLWPNAVQAYHRWVRTQHRAATSRTTSSSGSFSPPPGAISGTRRSTTIGPSSETPQNVAEVTALMFMGARVGCARCHAHPTENWTLDDNLGLAAFFAQVRYKRVGSPRPRGRATRSRARPVPRAGRVQRDDRRRRGGLASLGWTTTTSR